MTNPAPAGFVVSGGLEAAGLGGGFSRTAWLARELPRGRRIIVPGMDETGASMKKYFKLFPAVAGILALTTTMAFARDRREVEKDNFLRVRAEACELGSSRDAASGLLPVAIDSETGEICLVEIKREDRDDVDGVFSDRTGK